jgi:hypothetical protein
MKDPRIVELEELAKAEGFRLPMPADLIIFFEDHGFVVDLPSGQVHRGTVFTPTSSGRTVSHLLKNVEISPEFQRRMVLHGMRENVRFC